MLEEDGVLITDAPNDGGVDAPNQSYNFAPGNCGIVCTADAPCSTSGSGSNGHRAQQGETSRADEINPRRYSAEAVGYRLQSMKWGVIPSWSKQNPPTTSKAINCRDDSLKMHGGMWQTMKARKRCIVVAQGFFEWLNVNTKEKVPYFIKRRDDRLMCFAGLWDSIQHKGTLFHTC